MTRELNATGKGEATYDFKYDVLCFKVKDREYKKSLELGAVVADIDDKGFITGIRVFDASKVFGLTKTIIKGVSAWRFDALIQDNIVTITLRFAVLARNKVRENFTQQITHTLPRAVPNSHVAATA